MMLPPLLAAVQKGAERIKLLTMMLAHRGGHGFELGILKLIGILVGYPAAHGHMGQLILDHIQILAGQAAYASIGHK